MIAGNSGEKKKAGGQVPAGIGEKMKSPGSFRRTVTVAGAKSSGKSFVVSNIAYTFARRGVSTAVLDGDLEERSQWFYFNIPDEDKRYALKDILEAEEVPSLTDKGAFFMGGRLKVYTAAPYDMRFNRVGIRPEYGRLAAVMDGLRLEAGMVVTDNDGDIGNSFTRLSMSMADTVLLVVRPCYDELQKSRWMLEQLREDRLTLSKFILVINGFVSNRGFTAGDISRYLNGKFAGRVVIPADNAAAYESMRFGKPAVSFEGCCEDMKEAFETLAGLILGTV
jgi:cellulose biosynthesis protein BcsQ